MGGVTGVGGTGMGAGGTGWAGGLGGNGPDCTAGHGGIYGSVVGVWPAIGVFGPEVFLCHWGSHLESAEVLLLSWSQPSGCRGHWVVHCDWTGIW